MKHREGLLTAVSQVPSLAGLTAPSVTLRVGGRRVGVVGYLTPDTKHISNPEQLIITDEVEAVTREAARLHQQVNIVH